MIARQLAATLFGSIPKLLRLLRLSKSEIARQPLFDLYKIVGGVYVGGIHMKEDTNWEMHPDGDEALTLISGKIKLLLNDGKDESAVLLKSGQSFVVPKGIWHKQIVKQEGMLLFHTYGNTTKHKTTL